MFNFFRKKQSVVNNDTAVGIKTSNNYPRVVQEIHNEFFTAGDNILAEAKDLLLKSDQQGLEKGKKLSALGFGRTKEAVIAMETENKLIASKYILDLVTYYGHQYPYNKFITEGQVKIICEKYGLVCGETNMYKGFVPFDKLDIIENFKLKPFDINIVELENTCVTNISIGFYKKSELIGSETYILSPNFHKATTPFLKEMKNKALSLGIAENHIYIQRKKETLGMRICAPLKDMEIPENKMVEGYKIKDIPDPIVLQPVCGGYLIVCAWGDEASDPIVVNEKMN